MALPKVSIPNPPTEWEPVLRRPCAASTVWQLNQLQSQAQQWDFRDFGLTELIEIVRSLPKEDAAKVRAAIEQP